MKYKIVNNHFEEGYESLDDYCNWLKRKNSVVLFKIEEFTQVQLSSDPKLLEIRNLILDVSNDIARIPLNVVIDDEKL